MNTESILGRLLTNLNVLLHGLTVNAADLPMFAAQTTLLQQLRDEAIAINDQQEIAKAKQHQLTEQAAAMYAHLREEMIRARNGVRTVYGHRSLKLEEFGFKGKFPTGRPAAAPVEVEHVG